MGLRKLSQHLTNIELAVKTLQLREPFYDADAIDAELAAMFEALAAKRLATENAPGCGNSDSCPDEIHKSNDSPSNIVQGFNAQF